jgi:hypothetical protein
VVAFVFGVGDAAIDAQLPAEAGPALVALIASGVFDGLARL